MLADPEATRLEPRGDQTATTRKTRVGYYIFSTRIGGAEVYLRGVMHGLDRDRFEPILLLPPWPGLAKFLSDGPAPSVEMHPVDTTGPSVQFRGAGDVAEFGTEAPMSALNRLAKRMHLPRRVERFGMDMLRYRSLGDNRDTISRALDHANLDVFHVVNGGYPGAVSSLAAVIAGRQSGISTLMTVCSTAMPRTALAPFERRVDRRVAGAAESVIVPSRRPGDALVARDFDGGRLRFIPWGVADHPGTDRAAARARFHCDDSTLLVACLANFTPEKGQSIVVDVVAQLQAEFPGLRTILAGGGPQLDLVRQKAQSLGVTRVVAFPGKVERPWELLRAADVVVLASDMEGLPLVVLEALAQGTPVVATDVGGMPEAVVPGETGSLIPVRNPVALASALRDILANPHLREQMGRRGRTLYEARFTLEAMISDHQALYEECARLVR